MTVLPEPPAATAAGQAHLDDQAQKLLAAIEEAMATPTSYRDDTPVPVVGSAPPVPQPGRPPMSQGATDASVLMLAGGAATSMVGLTTAVVMYVSQYADPVVCGIVFGAPTAVVLALGRLAKKAKGVIPPETHNHYEGPVYQDQREQHSKTTGLWAKTNNEQ
jgi:hypothetical protein